MGDGNRYMILYHESYHGCLLQAEKEYSLWCSSTFMKLGKLDFSYKSVNGFVRIIGCSKGLICLYDSRYVPILGDILLWNPDDTKPAILPCSTFCYPISDNFSHMIIGFGFVPEIRDYKIVQIRYGSSLEDHHEVLVYMLSACSWRKIPACASCYVSPVSYASAYVNGEVHWIANNNMIDRFYDSILSFNLFREEFRKIALPDHDRNYKQLLLFPSAFEESLSLFYHCRIAPNEWWEIWLMGSYGRADSWTRLHTIAMTGISKPLGFMTSTVILLVTSDGCLVLFDPRTQASTSLGIMGSPGSFCAITYINR